MNNENLSIEVHDALNALSTYTFERLKNDAIQPDSLYPRKSYNYGLFIMSQSLLDGIITLSKKGQARSMAILLRSLQETWVNAFFSYAGPTHVWVYYLILQSENANLKKMKNLFLSGLAEEQAYSQKKRDYERLSRLVLRRYPSLPLIPGIIKDNGKTSLEDRSISFRQRCQVIDFYHSGNVNGTFVRNYETVYSFLSETVHASPRGINQLFSKDSKGNYSVDVSGGQNRRLLIIIMINSFLYHYDLMKNFNSSMSSNREHIPDTIKQLRRRLIILAKEIGKI